MLLCKPKSHATSDWKEIRGIFLAFSIHEYE